MIWLNSGLEWDNKSGQFDINGTDDFSSRGFIISVFSDFHNARHYLDWFLLYTLSISKQPSSDALDYPYVPFRLILTQLAKAFSQDQIIAHSLVAKVGKTTLSIEESISLLRLARDTFTVDESGSNVSTFIAMLENPYFQLGERFGGIEIYSEMERWNITPNSAFFSGSFSSNRALGGGGLRQLYVEQMLNEFIEYLINAALNFLNEREEE